MKVNGAEPETAAVLATRFVQAIQRDPQAMLRHHTPYEALQILAEVVEAVKVADRSILAREAARQAEEAAAKREER